MAMQPNGNGQMYFDSSIPNTPQHHHGCCRKQTWFEEMRGWIMVVAVLIASVTYASGLNPPGGFWQEDLLPDNKDGLPSHVAGVSILHDKYNTRFTIFFYANATAFMTSLVVIILLMNEKFYNNNIKVLILNISLVVGLMSLMIAYAAGSTRRFTTSLYVIALAGGVMVFVLYSANVMHALFGRHHNNYSRREIEAQNTNQN
ncbi:Ankyrin repeat family protein [Rhynchospora pubera]|uniref:Ankyrin repeat family protein n=1 Tax=Rhynchospora pubera TaxID=906938 RepID=A0AAV8HEH6_9POAL|nr:Ankyrin repeat family protein [Rhynchospora pubera]